MIVPPCYPVDSQEAEHQHYFDYFGLSGHVLIECCVHCGTIRTVVKSGDNHNPTIIQYLVPVKKYDNSPNTDTLNAIIKYFESEGD